jgi:uroporphyrinogen decarboxylase
MLNDEVPLIGFAGSGQLCVTVEGQGSKSFDKAKGFCFQYQKQHMFITKKSRTPLFYT